MSLILRLYAVIAIWETMQPFSNEPIGCWHEYGVAKCVEDPSRAGRRYDADQSLAVEEL